MRDNGPVRWYTPGEILDLRRKWEAEREQTFQSDPEILVAARRGVA